MSTPTIIGFPQSSYVWTARAALAIKGVAHDFQPISPPQSKAPEHLARHPYGKVPAFQHGDLSLFETSAITRYVDGAFDGPALQPDDLGQRAKMNQWISVIDCYFYGQVVPSYLLKYIFAPEGGPDRAQIDAAVPKIAASAAVLNAAVGDGCWLVGDQLTLADLFAGPLLMALTRLPEGQQIMAENPGLGRLVGALAQTGGFMAMAPRG